MGTTEPLKMIENTKEGVYVSYKVDCLYLGGFRLIEALKLQIFSRISSRNEPPWPPGGHHGNFEND